jgi:hypothetical protein
MPPRSVAFAEPKVVGDPRDIALLGAVGVMPDPQDLTYLFEKPHGSLHTCVLDRAG